MPPPPAELLALLQRYDPAIQRLLLRAREFVWRHARPETERVFAVKYTVAVWFGSEGKMSERTIYVAAFRRHVNIGFLHGATLPDPSKLLKGKGRQMRHMQIMTAADLDSAPLAALVRVGARMDKRRATRVP